MSEDKITTIDKLLEKIEQSQKHGLADDWTPEGQGYNNGLKRAIELIYKFDEGTRSELDEFRKKIEERIKRWEEAEPFTQMTKVLKGQILIGLKDLLSELKKIKPFSAEKRLRKNECPKCGSIYIVQGEKKVHAEYCESCGKIFRILSDYYSKEIKEPSRKNEADSVEWLDDSRYGKYRERGAKA